MELRNKERKDYRRWEEAAILPLNTNLRLKPAIWSWECPEIAYVHTNTSDSASSLVHSTCRCVYFRLDSQIADIFLKGFVVYIANHLSDITIIYLKTQRSNTPISDLVNKTSPLWILQDLEGQILNVGCSSWKIYNLTNIKFKENYYF